MNFQTNISLAIKTISYSLITSISKAGLGNLEVVVGKTIQLKKVTVWCVWAYIFRKISWNNRYPQYRETILPPNTFHHHIYKHLNVFSFFPFEIIMCIHSQRLCRMPYVMHHFQMKAFLKTNDFVWQSFDIRNEEKVSTIIPYNCQHMVMVSK